MLYLVLREAIIKKTQKSFTTHFHAYLYFFSFFFSFLQKSEKTVTKKGFQGAQQCTFYTNVFVLFPYFHTICKAKSGEACSRTYWSMGSQVLHPPAPGCHSGNQTRLWSLGDSDLREFGAIWNGVCLKTVWAPFKVNSKLAFDWREGKI